MGRKMTTAAALTALAIGALTPSLALAHGNNNTAARSKRAKTAPKTRVATIEIQQIGTKGAKRSRRYVVAVAEGWPASRLESQDAAAQLRLKLRLDGTDAKSAVLRLGLRRSVPSNGKVTRTEIDAASRLSFGKPAVMGQIDLPGGDKLRIVATLR